MMPLQTPGESEKGRASSIEMATRAASSCRRMARPVIRACAPSRGPYHDPFGKQAARHHPQVGRIADVVSGSASSQKLDRHLGRSGHFLKFGKNLRETLREISNDTGVLQQPAEIPPGHHQIQVVGSIALLDKLVFLIEFG